MIRTILLSLLFIFVGTIAYGQTTSLSGKLTDADTGEAVMFANVAIYKNGVLVTGVETDLDGNYYFSNIDSGKYDIESSFIGYATVKLADVVVSIRGARTDATVYYIDGVQVRGNLIPESEIDQLQVITGGVDASYGDVVGGVISITTKGPSNNFGGGIEVETSEPFDNYGYNLFRGNVSGPLLKKKYEDGSEKSIIGFRVSGQYRKQDDDDPPALPQNLTNADVEALDFRPNEDNERYDITAKIDARLTDNIDITLSGTFNNEDNLFTPGYGSSVTASGRGNASFGAPWTTFNSNNNPISQDQRIRGNFRFRHRLSAQPNSANSEDAPASVVQNASYTLQLGYERQELEIGDSRHGDNLFNYGHIGRFDFDFIPAYGDSDYTGAIPNPIGNFSTAHVDYTRQFAGYTPGDTNPVLANYNNLVVDPQTEGEFSAINGEFNGAVTSVWNFHDNVGAVYNLYRKRNREFLTFNVNSNFDILPDGKSEKGRHSLQFGIRYEQRFERGFDISPRALWTTARQLSNRHLTSVDTFNIIDTVIDTGGIITGVEGAELNIFSPIDNSAEQDGNYFFERARAINGTAINEFFNVDAIDPSLLNLGLFSAQELNDQTLLNLNYYGFNYQGERIPNTVTFDDFFTSRDENGVRDLPVAAFQQLSH